MFGGSAYLFAIIKYFLSLFSVYSFCNATFFHSGYVIKPPQPSCFIYGAPPFAGNLVQVQYSTEKSRGVMQCVYNCRGVTRGAQFSGRRVTMGPPKSPSMSQVLSSIQNICFRKSSVSNMDVGAKLPSCPVRQITSLRPCNCIISKHC